MSDDELISSANWLLSVRKELYLARLTTFPPREGGGVANLMSLDFSKSEMKDAMSSSSVLASPELPSVGWLNFSFEEPPELAALSAALLLWLVHLRGRLAKLEL